MNVLAVVCNVALLVLAGWAFVDQYPHPEESGFVAFVVFVFATPIVNILAILLSGAGSAWTTARKLARLCAIALSIVLFVFACFVIATDGVSGEAVYVVFSVMLVLVPLYTAGIILHSKPAVAS